LQTTEKGPVITTPIAANRQLTALIGNNPANDQIGLLILASWHRKQVTMLYKVKRGRSVSSHAVIVSMGTALSNITYCTK
jgi:hypothetical protein